MKRTELTDERHINKKIDPGTFIKDDNDFEGLDCFEETDEVFYSKIPSIIPTVKCYRPDITTVYFQDSEQIEEIRYTIDSGTYYREDGPCKQCFDIDGTLLYELYVTEGKEIKKDKWMELERMKKLEMV